MPRPPRSIPARMTYLLSEFSKRASKAAYEALYVMHHGHGEGNVNVQDLGQDLDDLIAAWQMLKENAGEFGPYFEVSQERIRTQKIGLYNIIVEHVIPVEEEEALEDVKPEAGSSVPW